jgi:hypothetical protein
VNAGSEAGRLHISGFPSSETLNVLAVTDGRVGSPAVFKFTLTTDPTGSATSFPSPSGPPDRPVTVGVVVYRDLNGDSRWDPDTDDILYQGDGTVTECPQSVTLSPK